jgi:hypothetical protein
MVQYIVSLTSAEDKAMKYAAVSVQGWIDNAAHNRARVAADEITSRLIVYCNENSIQIATGSDAQVEQAYELGVVETLASVASRQNAGLE